MRSMARMWSSVVIDVNTRTLPAEHPPSHAPQFPDAEPCKQSIEVCTLVHISLFPPSGHRGTLGPVDLMQCSVIWVVRIFVPRFGRIGSQAGMAPHQCVVICQTRIAHDRGSVPTLVKRHSGAGLRRYSMRGWGSHLRKVPCEFVLTASAVLNTLWGYGGAKRCGMR